MLAHALPPSPRPSPRPAGEPEAERQPRRALARDAYGTREARARGGDEQRVLDPHLEERVEAAASQACTEVRDIRHRGDERDGPEGTGDPSPSGHDRAIGPAPPVL